MQRLKIDQEVPLHLGEAARTQGELFLRQVGLQRGQDRLLGVGLRLGSVLRRIVPEANAGLQVASTLAGSREIVPGEVEGEFARRTGNRVAVDPAPGDAVGAPAQAQAKAGEVAVAEQPLADTSG